VSCVKAAECYSVNGIVVAHDRINRFLTRQSLTPATLWNEVERYVEKRIGWLIVDDTVIDKIHSKQIELTYYQWSGKPHSVVKGIGLITQVWTDGTSTFPVDYRIYNKDGDELSKNEHFRDMLKTASVRGFQPAFVMFELVFRDWQPEVRLATRLELVLTHQEEPDGQPGSYRQSPGLLHHDSRWWLACPYEEICAL